MFMKNRGKKRIAIHAQDTITIIHIFFGKLGRHKNTESVFAKMNFELKPKS